MVGWIGWLRGRPWVLLAADFGDRGFKGCGLRLDLEEWVGVRHCWCGKAEWVRLRECWARWRPAWRYFAIRWYISGAVQLPGRVTWDPHGTDL